MWFQILTHWSKIRAPHGPRCGLPCPRAALRKAHPSDQLLPTPRPPHTQEGESPPHSPACTPQKRAWMAVPTHKVGRPVLSLSRPSENQEEEQPSGRPGPQAQPGLHTLNLHGHQMVWGHVELNATEKRGKICKESKLLVRHFHKNANDSRWSLSNPHSPGPALSSASSHAIFTATWGKPFREIK